MRVQFSVVGSVVPFPNVYAILDAVPREGETVTLPGLPAELQNVRTVVWYPQGDPDAEADDGKPFVYVVLGPRRPE